jgi:two-component system sensor histidine kinase HydH
MRALADTPPQPVVDRARERVIQTLLVWRARALPAFSSMALIFIWLDPRPWRIALLTTTAVTLAIISLVELRAFKRGVPLTPMRVRVNLVISGLCQLGLMIGSGALASPIAPAVLIVALMFNLSAPRRLAAIFVLTVHVPAVWLLALAHTYDVVPGLVPFAGLATVMVPASGAFLAAFAYTLFFVGAVTLGQWIRGTLDAAVEERVAEQQRLLELHRDTARTMSSLSAEIAHELKNPLASIKGLAGLLRRDVDGPGKERLEVMRGEIDRMQAILEEFLHYSRPVVPLELRPTALRGLATEVLALHDGMALSRGVSLEVGDTDVVATCDPRKIRQILVNLVQNAIEASPSQGAVRLALSTRGGEVIVDVEDRGPGLAPEVRGALFEVGATTKPKGSGIGLAVARGLARQHDGDLTLEDREGGGCRARLVLPIDGPEVEPLAETAAPRALEAAPAARTREPSSASGPVDARPAHVQEAAP